LSSYKACSHSAAGAESDKALAGVMLLVSALRGASLSDLIQIIL